MSSELQTRPRPRLVGHKGAAELAPGNTLESFDAALAAGVDMIEFDVLSERPDGGGALLIAHDYHALARAERPLTLQEALEHLGSDQFAAVELDLDMKLPGYAGRVLDALRQAGLAERSLVSCAYAQPLDEIRQMDPGVRLGLSVPRVRRDYTEDRLWALPALAALVGYRAILPARARRALAAGRIDAVMAHWRVVTRALVRAVAGAGGELYVWTVNDPQLMAKLIAMGVDGVITDDPSLLARLGEGSPAGGA